MSWIQTASGRKMSFLEPDPAEVDILDIAHALSHLCRYNGQCSQFYSVAEHSVWVSHEVNEQYAMAGLLHDAAEAYIGDLPGPLKHYLPDFKEVETRLEEAIASAFGLRVEDLGNAEVKRADKQLLADEKVILMGKEPAKWPDTMPPPKHPELIRGWNPGLARFRFMSRYRDLCEVGEHARANKT